MTVALLLAAAPDRRSAMTQPYRQPGDRLAGDSAMIDGVGRRLLDAGMRQVEVAMCADTADGLRAVADTARRSAEPVLVCTAARVLATPRAALAALLAGPAPRPSPPAGHSSSPRRTCPPWPVWRRPWPSRSPPGTARGTAAPGITSPSAGSTARCG